MFAEANYFNAESKGIRIEVDTFGETFTPYTNFREALTDILTAVDGCDTYCISEDFEVCGYKGYLRLYNLNRNVVYYLSEDDINHFAKYGNVGLQAFEATEDDINDFESRY